MHRLEMCRLAVAKDERLAVSRLEIDREGPSYTADTLRAVHESAPGDDLTFIVGGDMGAEALEMTYDATQGLHQAPLSVIAQGGVLVIDDLGRQGRLLGGVACRAVVDMRRFGDNCAWLRRRAGGGARENRIPKQETSRANVLGAR